MKSDVEKLLTDVRPPGPSFELRTKVLDAVQEELSGAKRSRRRRPLTRAARWERRIGWASVLGLLVAIGLNFLIYRVGPVPSGSLPGDSSTGIYQQQYARYQQILQQAAIFEKGYGYVYIQKNHSRPEVGGDHSGRSPSDTSYYQRRDDLDHRLTG